MEKDYYLILGVGENATQQQVKEEYRKLALKYHPDRNRDNPEAAGRMKEINESYAVLSNPQKRSEYDRLRQLYGSSAYERFKKTHTEQDIFRGSDIYQVLEELSRAFGFRGFEEIFKEFYGPGFRTFEFRGPGASGRVFTGRSGSEAGRKREINLEGTPGKLIKFGLKKLFGIEVPEKGKNIYDRISISRELADKGGKIKYVNRRLSKELLVNIPAGIREKQQIRLKGMGGRGKGEGEPGDLFIQIRFRKAFTEKIFRLIGLLRS